MPSPHKKSFAAEQLARQKKKNPLPWIVAGIAVAVVVIGISYVLYLRHQVQEKPEAVAPVPEEIPSIAVLCFNDMSPNRDQEPFCEGITEEIINKLTQIRDIRTIARNSSFMFKGQHPDVKVVGDTLDVHYVLEGSLRKQENRLRITAQLVKVDDRSHVWSKNYDRELRDIFEVQDEIAMAIVEELKGEILGEEKAAIEKRHTENTEAYNLYFLGRYHLYNRSEEEINKALYYFKKAIEIDPQYARAYTGIADSYHVLGISHYLSPQEAHAEAKKWAEKALETDDTIAEPYISLASVSLWYDWDWEAARNNYERAIELNPSNADAHHWYADYFKAMGKYEKAMESMKRAHEIDPLSYIVNLMLSEMYFKAGRTEEALQQCYKTIELNPNDGRSYFSLGWMYGTLGDHEKAVNNLEKAITLSGSFWSVEGFLGYYYAKSGERNKAQNLLTEVIKRKKEHYVSSFNIALIYFGLEERDTAYEWLEQAYKEREPFMTIIKSYIDSGIIPSGPRTQALLKKMGLPQ